MKITNSLKESIAKFISTKTLKIEPIIVDPEVYYIHPVITCRFNKDLVVGSTDLQSKIKNAVSQYSSNDLENFSKNFLYSRFLEKINYSDSSILSSFVEYKVGYRIPSNIGEKQNILCYFGNEISSGSLFSTSFSYFKDGVVNRDCKLKDVDGNVAIVSSNGSVLVSSVGTIDYKKGIVKFEITVSEYVNYVEILVETENKDFIASNNTVLKIDNSNINIALIDSGS